MFEKSQKYYLFQNFFELNIERNCEIFYNWFEIRRKKFHAFRKNINAYLNIRR
jgi:hypothetical protein